MRARGIPALRFEFEHALISVLEDYVALEMGIWLGC